MILIPERASHWYHKDGTPCHQVQAKSGKGLRDATLRDARELGLLPSVTGILKVIAKPELENWKITQGIIAALTLPRQRESIEEWMRRTAWENKSGLDTLRWAYENPPRFIEDEQVFAKRVVEDSEKQAGEAAEFGRRIHKEIEAWLLKAPVSEDPEIEPYLKHVKDWAAHEVEEVHAAECVVASPKWGFAGTLDLHCKLRCFGEAVVDFKTQGIKNDKPVFYDEWGLQLAAYSAALAFAQHPNSVTPPLPSLVSIIINSKEPGPVFYHQWKEPDHLWHLFRCAFELWKNQKNYNPCPK